MALPLIRALEEHPGRWNLARLITFGSGGAVFSQQAQARLKAQLPNVMISNGMGSSESGVLGGRDRVDHSGGFMVLDRRPDLAVIDDEGRLVDGPGAEGTLARTGYTPIGYYGDPVKSAQTFVNIEGRIWVVTGDRVRVDDEGNYVVMGRGSQCINTGGEKVYPEEVEEAVRHYGAIKDVLVVGVPDERWGQKVVAVASLLAGVQFDRAEFDRSCRERLAGYKLPREVVLVDEVKRSPAGKADYGWAKKVAAERLTA
jgi:fatty-acyl-CoA synthase